MIAHTYTKSEDKYETTLYKTPEVIFDTGPLNLLEQEKRNITAKRTTSLFLWLGLGFRTKGVAKIE